MRLLGIDYGAKKIGLAFSDEKASLAFPYLVLENDRNLLKKIIEICREKRISKIVLGQSLDYKSRPNIIMKEIEGFKDLLEKELRLPVVFENEVLTTCQARRALAGERAKAPAAVKKRPKRRQKMLKEIDASAAALILQSYLDKQNLER